MDASQPARLAESLKRFEIPDVLRFENPASGLPHFLISTPTAEARLYLQGARRMTPPPLWASMNSRRIFV